MGASAAIGAKSAHGCFTESHPELPARHRVSIGGLSTASAILHRDLISEVQSGKIFGDPSKLTAGGPGWDPLEACRHMAKKSRSKSAAARQELEKVAG